MGQRCIRPANSVLWELHGKLVLWTSSRMSWYFKQPQHAMLGSCWIAFVKSVENYDPEKGEFSTYFHRSAIINCRRWLDSDSMRAEVKRCRSSHIAHREATLIQNYAENRGNGRFYHIPEVDQDWVGSILELFDGNTMGLWMSLTEGLTPRQVDIVFGLFSDNLNMAELGARLGITRERVRQIWMVILEKMRAKVQKLEAVRKLFGIGSEMEVEDTPLDFEKVARREKNQFTLKPKHKKRKDHEEEGQHRLPGPGRIGSTPSAVPGNPPGETPDQSPQLGEGEPPGVDPGGLWSQ